MKDKKSPLKNVALRNAGQSLDEEIGRVIDEEILIYYLISVIVVFLAMFEWIRWFREVPLSPWTLTIIAALVVSYSLYKALPMRKKLKAMRQGRDGEKETAFYLDQLRETGAKVFHDIVSDSFNIDHVVVSRKGVLLIETKTYSKPAKGETKIIWDGKKILINGAHYNDDILIQTQASSKWLRNLINELTAKNYNVKPVIVFPGWFVQMTRWDFDTWVLNPQILKGFLAKQPDILTDHDIQLISNHLSRYIGST